MPNNLQTIAHRLETVGQGHLLRFYDQLSDDQKRSLLNQISAIDLEALPKLVHDYVINKPVFALPPEVQPAPYYPRNPASARRSWDESAYRTAGESMLRAGRVAAFVVAGGQGSRLGYEGPKGCYPAGAVTNKPLFAVFADAIHGAKDRYGVHVPWYIMTSPLNHQATVEFFEANGFFGLDRANVMFFPQGVLPSLDIKTGKVLLASKQEVATNPDGHGGSLKALHVSGALADMRRRGVDTISYFQVDNPIVNFLDPVFLGLHASAPDSSGQMSSKMVAKAFAEEKVGVFCMSGAGARKGRVEIVEYSDLPMEYQRQTNEDGSLKFNAGSIAVHIIGVPFVERLNTDASFALPYHRAEKKIPCVDVATGETIAPTANNGVKLERFVFDALPMCEKSIVYETDRIDEFAPIKNADEAKAPVEKPAPDSPADSRRIQTLRAARWLEEVGVAVPRDASGAPECVLEISPRTATCPQELKLAKLPRAIERGQRLAI
jgi:UDP-N-acetylglucosamine/UDP-N-acetylgalactosamine diphosphorylase